MTDSREVSIKFTVETAGGVAKVKNMTAAIKKAGESVKKTGKASTAAGKKFGKASRSMQTAAQRTEKKMRKLRASLGNVKESLNSLAQTARRTAAVMIGGAAAVTAVYSRFERAMIRTTAVAVGGEKGFSNAFRSMSKEAMKVANTTEHTAKQVGEGMEFMAMAGLKPAQIIAATAATADLASAANIRMADAANIATNVMTGFGMKAEDLVRVNNVLTGTFTNSNVNIMQLGESFKVVGANASILGISIEEVSAALGLLGNVGIQGTEAGTGLKRALSAIVKPSGQAADAMSRLGLNTKVLTDGSKNMRGGLLRMLAILQGTQKAYKEAGKTTEFLADMFMLFGERAGPKMAAMLKQGTDAFIDLQSSAEDAVSVDVTKWIAGIQRESVKGKFDILVSNIESAGIALGEAFAPAAISAMDAIRDLAESVSSISRETMTVIGRIAKLVLVLGGIGAAFLTAAAGVVSFKYAMAGLAPVFALIKARVVGMTAAVAAMRKSWFLFGFSASAVAISLAPFIAAAALSGIAIAALTRDLGEFDNGVEKSLSLSSLFDGLTSSADSFFLTLEAGFASFASGLTFSLMDVSNVLDGIADKMGVLAAIKFGGLQGAGAIDDYLKQADSSAGSSARKGARSRVSMAGVKSVEEQTKATATALFKGYEKSIKKMQGVFLKEVDREEIKALVHDTGLTERIKKMDSEGFKNLTDDLKKYKSQIDMWVLNVRKIAERERRRIADLTMENTGLNKEQLFALKASKSLVVDEFVRSNMNYVSNLNSGMSRVNMAVKKEAAARESAAAEAARKAKAWAKSMTSFFDSLIKKTNQMKVKLISAFSPQEGAAAGAANQLANSVNSFGKALRDGAIGAKSLDANTSTVSDYASTLAKATLNQAGSSLAAAWGTEKFSKMLSKSTNRLVPAIARAQDAFGNYTNAFNMNAEQVSSSLAMYAFAHVDFAGKIKKASSERIAAEKKYISAMSNLDSMVKGMDLELEKLRSPAPEMTGIFQQARGREEDIARDVADAIAASGAREKAAQKQSQLIALQELQTQVQGALVTATGTLISAIGHLIAALNKGETKESKAIVAQGINTQGMAKNLQSKMDAAVANVDIDAMLTWDDEIKSATKKGNEASRTSTELTLEHAKANLKMGATIEGIIASVGVLNKKGKDAEQIVGSIPFSKIESGASSISDAFQKSMGKMLDSILSVEFDTKDNVTGGKFLGKDVSAKTMGKLAKARDVGAEIIDSIDINQIGASIGMGIGGLIGAFAGDPAIGAQIGKAAGTVIEAAVMFIPAVVKKITKGLSSAVNKAASFVPEQRFQGGVKKGMDSFSKAMMALAPIIVAAQAPFVIIGMLAGPLAPIVWGLQAFAIGIGIAAGGFLALGPALFGFLTFLGAQEMKYNRVVGSALDEDAGITELDENYRTPFARIMDALAVSVDRVVFAMGPFYENLFVLVGLFDMFMETFVILADELGDVASIGPDMLELFKGLALGLISVITAVAQFHNIMISLPSTLLRFEASIFDFIGTMLSKVPGMAAQASAFLADADESNRRADEYDESVSGLIIDTDRLQEVFARIQNAGRPDFMDRFNLLDRAASMDDDSADKAKEFGEQLTNVPSGFKVNLARFKAMDADGEGGALDMGGGRSIMDIDATDFFGRMTQAVRAGTAESLGSLVNAIGSLDDVIRPDNWEDIFGHPLDRMSNELGNAFDSLTNTLGLALLGPEEAFQGGGGMGAAMGGRQAGGNITSGSNTMNININELSIADAANPDQLANMIAERSTRNQMAQAGTPFPSHQSGSGWWGGNEGGGGRS